jgi:hypothetical protein
VHNKILLNDGSTVFFYRYLKNTTRHKKKIMSPYSSLLVLLLVGCACAAPFRFTTTNVTCSRFVQWNRLVIPNNVTAPGRRFDPAVVVDPRTNNLFVSGGTSDQFESFSDNFRFDPGKYYYAYYTLYKFTPLRNPKNFRIVLRGILKSAVLLQARTNWLRTAL